MCQHMAKTARSQYPFVGCDAKGIATEAEHGLQIFATLFSGP